MRISLGAGAGRRGNTLIMIGIFGTLIFLAVCSLAFLTRTDTSTTQNLLRELHATYLGESIAAQVEVQVNSRPWNERFWKLSWQVAGGTGVPMASLTRTSKVVDLSGDTLPQGDFDYVGVVKDLQTELRQYRLYLEVTVRGETYTFSWDKRHEQTLLTGLSRDATQVDKVIETDGGATTNDNLLEGIKVAGNKAPPTDQSTQTQTARRDDLRRDRKSHRARTTLPDSGAAPADPSDAIKQVQDAEKSLKGKGGG